MGDDCIAWFLEQLDFRAELLAAALEFNPGHGDDAAVASGPLPVSTAATIHRPPAMPTISSLYGILIRMYFF